MEVLSEHMCEGWLEGYLLTGRHGFFSCYEAFIHIVDSMFNQHAKWLKTTRALPWRKPLASLNYLLTSHVWRQDHNGFSHQDPGFIDHVANKKADVVRIYLPPDANTLLSVADHCLRSRNYVNLIIAGKQPAPMWLDMDAAVRHCTVGLGAWTWASNDGGVARRGHGLRRGRTDAGDPRRRLPAPRGAPRPPHAGGQRRGPDGPSARLGAPARPVRRGVRCPVHSRQAGHLRLPWVSDVDPPPHLPEAEPRQHPRSRVSGGGHDDDALRHGGPEPHGSIPPGAGRDPASATTRGDRGPRQGPVRTMRSGGTRHTSRSMARICPRSGTGPGTE